MSGIELDIEVDLKINIGSNFYRSGAFQMCTGWIRFILWYLISDHLIFSCEILSRLQELPCPVGPGCHA